MNDELMKQALRRQQQRADELKMPDDMEQRVKRRLARRSSSRRRWWLTAAAAVAAALVLTFWSGGHDEADPQRVAVAAPPVERPQQAAVPDTAGTMPRLAEKTERKVTAKRRRPAKAVEEPSLPDTLGQGIWKSRANVILALQVLSECERDIERAHQVVRNTVIEATFNAVPAPGGCLVVNENGDYRVCEATEENIIL